MTQRILKINYTQVAAHLGERLARSQDPDTPPHNLTFGCVHGILTSLFNDYEGELNYPFGKEHLTEVPYGTIGTEAQALTEILFADLGSDSFDDVVISNTPGVVTWYKENPIMFPLVLIKVS